MADCFLAMSSVMGLMIFLALYRVFKGPSVFDRLTGLALIGTKTVVLLILIGALQNRVGLYIDIALAYALIGFVGPLALSKYFELKDTSES